MSRLHLKEHGSKTTLCGSRVGGSVFTFSPRVFFENERACDKCLRHEYIGIYRLRALDEDEPGPGAFWRLREPDE